MGLLKLTDGVLERQIEIDSDGRARSKLVQPSRNVILERNARERREGNVRSCSFMGLEMTIPLEDWYNLVRKYPALDSSDHDEQQAAMRGLLASREADIYRVS